ncbi:AMP-binding protein [Desulfovibrio sp. Huiquan2017]|uniref:AMP-binding protein n=1 Tax=Desulfovibrio sp. Huiquan2017 TaxID=2816861 RepID=UPI001A932A06|nr:AMP-binding protein [Desulfovibrio sp. Huiquan2017]
MRAINLQLADIREIISSVLLAHLSYDACMRLAPGGSLSPEFVPTCDAVDDLEGVGDIIAHMFHAKPPANIGAISLEAWAESVYQQWLAAGDRMTFFTSGSTNEPKPATHDFGEHVQEVENLALLFQDRKRIVCFVPRHHIYGFLFSILLPRVMGLEVRWVVPLPTPGLARSLRDGDLMVAFPLLWGKLAEMGVHFHADVHGVTSTGPCPAKTIEMVKANGLPLMYEIYGSSETGGVGYRTDHLGCYTLLDHWTRTDDDAVLARKTEGGGATECLLQDLLDWYGPATFTPRRRKDCAVQVAGVNVYPARVREVLLDHPLVEKCAVRLMRSDEGTRLKAFIVPYGSGQDIGVLKLELQKWSKAHLSRYERPASWTFGKHIPVNGLGKERDW